MKRCKDVLTTGEVAKICNVAPRTVSKWFDKGHLRGYRIPGSRDRRIPRDQLIRFMRSNGMPLDEVGSGATRILILDSDASFRKTLEGVLANGAGYEVAVAESAFEAGAILQELQPDVLIVDVTMKDIDPRAISRFIRSRPELSETRIIAASDRHSTGQREAVLQAGFDGYLAKPFEARTLIELIEKNVQHA